MEELLYGIGHMLEALRLEIRATALRQPIGCTDSEAVREMLWYQGEADKHAALAKPAINNPLERKEGG